MSPGGRRAALAGATLGASAWAFPALAPVAPPVARMLGIRRRIAGEAVSLTFDDGPHPEGTPAVLEELARAGAHATFFCVGEQAERRPALVREILAAGHEVALHGHRHRNSLRLTPRAAAEDLRRGADAVGGCTGRPLRLHRPPYGIYSPALLAVVHDRGLEPVLWSRWGRDWRKHTTPNAIARRVSQGVQAGDVLLLHDADFYSADGSWRRTAAALPLVFEELARRGLHTAPPSR